MQAHKHATTQACNHTSTQACLHASMQSHKHAMTHACIHACCSRLAEMSDQPWMAGRRKHSPLHRTTSRRTCPSRSTMSHRWPTSSPTHASHLLTRAVLGSVRLNAPPSHLSEGEGCSNHPCSRAGTKNWLRAWAVIPGVGVVSLEFIQGYAGQNVRQSTAGALLTKPNPSNAFAGSTWGTEGKLLRWAISTSHNLGTVSCG